MGQSEDDSTEPDRRRTRDESGGDSGLNRRQLLLFGGVATVGLFALTRGEEFGSQEADKRDIRVLLHLNAHTVETADLEGHMETLHPEAPIRSTTETRVNKTIQSHNVTVDLSVETITLDNETAQARAVRTTRGTADDPGYPDTRERITYELRQHDGEWLVYNRTITGTEQPPPDTGDN